MGYGGARQHFEQITADLQLVAGTQRHVAVGPMALSIDGNEVHLRCDAQHITAVAAIHHRVHPRYVTRGLVQHAVAIAGSADGQTRPRYGSNRSLPPRAAVAIGDLHRERHCRLLIGIAKFPRLYPKEPPNSPKPRPASCAAATRHRAWGKTFRP